jgi:hypothetical protein
VTVHRGPTPNACPLAAGFGAKACMRGPEVRFERVPRTSSRAGGPPERCGLPNGHKEQWVIPPEARGQFVARIEDVLQVYHRPYDARRPTICLHDVPM